MTAYVYTCTHRALCTAAHQPQEQAVCERIYTIIIIDWTLYMH